MNTNKHAIAKSIHDHYIGQPSRMPTTFIVEIVESADTVKY